MIESLVGFLIGMLLGIIPGLHPNLVIALVLGMGMPVKDSIAFYIPLMVGNVMFDAIPSSMLGVAEEGKELALHETQRLASKGMAWYSSMKMAYSSFFGFVASSFTFPLSLLIIPWLESIISPWAGLLLAAIAVINIMLDGTDGLIIFSMSAMLGALSFLMPLPSGAVFLPLLTGLFASPFLILSIINPSKTIQTKQMPLYDNFKGMKRGAFAGIFSNLIPAIGPSQLVFMFSLSSINFTAFSSSLAASSSVYAIATAMSTGKARSGIAVPFSSFHPLLNETIEIPLYVIASASLSMLLIVWFSWDIIKLLSSTGQARLSISVLVFLIAMTLLLSGFTGLAIFAASTGLGMYAQFRKARKTQLLGCIIYPALLMRYGFM